MFWALDAFYLHLERSYRALFDAVRRRVDPSDFAMSTSRTSAGYLRALVTPSVACIYIALLLVSATALCLLGVSKP